MLPFPTRWRWTKLRSPVTWTRQREGLMHWCRPLFARYVSDSVSCLKECWINIYQICQTNSGLRFLKLFWSVCWCHWVWEASMLYVCAATKYLSCRYCVVYWRSSYKSMCWWNVISMVRKWQTESYGGILHFVNYELQWDNWHLC